ncbi:MAG TPA: SIMPL domain-containing protein [Verrucomicrobiae bacterium]
MKSTLWLSIILGSGLLFGTTDRMHAQDAAHRTLSVSATGEIKVVPDIVELTGTVETRAENQAAAQFTNDLIMAQVIASLKQSGMADTNIQTGVIIVTAVYNQDYPAPINLNPGMNIDPATGLPSPPASIAVSNNNTTNAPSPIYYIAHKRITATLQRVQDFDKTLSSLTAAGLNSVQGIRLRTSQLEEHQEEARQLAIKVARKKAQTAAAALEIEIGKPISINLDDSYRGYTYYGGGGGGGSDEDGINPQSAMGARSGNNAFEAGQITIRANVAITFEIK